eukprot:EG_transcript_51413
MNLYSTIFSPSFVLDETAEPASASLRGASLRISPPEREAPSPLRGPAIHGPVVCIEFQMPHTTYSGLQVGMWHPLLGPSSLALWHGQGQLAGDVAASTCRQTLLGEMGGVTTEFAAQRRDVAYKV